jgi:hypothetical protein
MLVDGRRVLGFGDWLFFVVVVSDDFSARIYTEISLTIGCFDPYSIDRFDCYVDDSSSGSLNYWRAAADLVCFNVGMIHFSLLQRSDLLLRGFYSCFLVLAFLLLFTCSGALNLSPAQRAHARCFLFRLVVVCRPLPSFLSLRL